MTALLLLSLLLASGISGTRQVTVAGLQLAMPARWVTLPQTGESQLFADYQRLAQPGGALTSLAIARFAPDHKPTSLQEAMNLALGAFVNPDLATSDDVLRVTPYERGELKGLTVVILSRSIDADELYEAHQIAVLTDGQNYWILAQQQFIPLDPWTGRPMKEQIDHAVFARSLASLRRAAD